MSRTNYKNNIIAIWLIIIQKDTSFVYWQLLICVTTSSTILNNN